MMKEFFLVLALTALSVTYASAQSTLGYSYADLQKEYNAKASLINWHDDKADDGSAFVSYREKGNSISYCSYFIGGETVDLYILFGNAIEFANIWASYANEHFTKQQYGIWIDYSARTKWELEIKGKSALFKATRVTD